MSLSVRLKFALTCVLVVTYRNTDDHESSLGCPRERGPKTPPTKPLKKCRVTLRLTLWFMIWSMSLRPWANIRGQYSEQPITSKQG